MDKAYNHSHLLLHVTRVVWALWVLWRDRDWERNTSSTSTRTRGTMVPTRTIGTPRKAGWTLRPGETWVNHRAGAQPGRRHRLDTFLVKTASLQIVIILRNNHLLHWLAWKKHRPIAWKASVQLVARTLQKEIICLNNRVHKVYEDMNHFWSWQLGYQRQTDLKKPQDFKSTLSGDIRLALCKCLITFANMIKSLSTNQITNSS